MRLEFCRIVVAMVLIAAAVAEAGENLVSDPSFEEPKERDRWGHGASIVPSFPSDPLLGSM